MKINKNWFTLIEILFWILIFSIVIIWWFQALSAITIWKIKLTEKVTVSKDAMYFSEKLFEEIKSGWTIDYEEYFNRKIVWTSTSSWHYSLNTWFWNFWNNWTPWNLWIPNYWNGFYFCRSQNWVNMWTWGCYNQTDFNDLWANWWPQRYWQYAFQFIDYNSNENSDLWDQDNNWNIRWDDDDENLWEWPIVFTWWENVREIYLISWDWKKRTYFRWTWKEDPWKNRPSTATCNDPNVFWSWCIWTIEMLKLDWKDWWVNHNFFSTSSWSFDWIIDTWVVNSDFAWSDWVVAWTWNIDDYWQPLFWENINVSNFEVYLYPNVSIKNAWKDLSDSSNINPYLRLNITLEPSWKKRAWMKGSIPKIQLNTTINLVDYFTK